MPRRLPRTRSPHAAGPTPSRPPGTATTTTSSSSGSGFGGAVSALRLTEKGYRVGVLEAGRRFTRETLPKNSWDIRNYLWAPALGCYGIQRVHLLGNVMVLAGAGVGGGSLNYANTLYVPPQQFFDDQQWGHITDWHAELTPYYDQAKRMLGVRLNPTMTPVRCPSQGRRTSRWASATPSTWRRSASSSATADDAVRQGAGPEGRARRRGPRPLLRRQGPRPARPARSAASA